MARRLCRSPLVAWLPAEMWLWRVRQRLRGRQDGSPPFRSHAWYHLAPFSHPLVHLFLGLAVQCTAAAWQHLQPDVLISTILICGTHHLILHLRRPHTLPRVDPLLPDPTPRIDLSPASIRRSSSNNHPRTLPRRALTLRILSQCHRIMRRYSRSSLDTRLGHT